MAHGIWRREIGAASVAGAESSGAVQRRSPAPAPAPAPRSTLAVLLATGNQLFAERLKRGLAGVHRIALDVSDAGAFEPSTIAKAGARVVVIDVALLQSGAVDAQTARQLTQRGIQVLLLFARIGDSAVPLCLQARAHGCIDVEITPQGFLEAVEAVARGEVWFPRWMTEPLYFMALSRAARSEAESGVKGSTHADLTERENQVMHLVERGLTNKQIAQELGISPNTVKKHLHNALDKHGIRRRRQLYK